MRLSHKPFDASVRRPYYITSNVTKPLQMLITSVDSREEVTLFFNSKISFYLSEDRVNERLMLIYFFKYIIKRK